MNGKGSTRRKSFVNNETFANNWDEIFVKDKTSHIRDEQNFKFKQQDLTELNGDGNRERGRYGEDES